MGLIAYKAGVGIETVGSWLDRIPCRPLYRSQSALDVLNADDEKDQAECARDYPDEDWWKGDWTSRRKWFGVISGWGCRLGICGIGINLMERNAQEGTKG